MPNQQNPQDQNPKKRPSAQEQEQKGKKLHKPEKNEPNTQRNRDQFR